MHNFIIAYDIFDTKRLAKVKKIAYSFALGGQKSALEVPLNKQLLKEFLQQVKPILEDADKINIIKIFGTPILLAKASQISYENHGMIIL